MKSINSLVIAYNQFHKGASHLQSLALLAVRLVFGWTLYLSGYGHLNDVEKMVTRFQNWGVPLPRFNVYVSGSTEMIGGALLMAGLATRLISIPLVINFCVAMATAGKDNFKQLFLGGQILSADDFKPGRLSALEAIANDSAFPYLVVSLLLIAFGPGRISIDHLLKRTVFRRHADDSCQS